ncbi:unnamed protein product [Lampetra planeri]
MMLDIDDRTKLTTVQRILKNVKTIATEESRRAELEKELAAVVKDTLQGLKKLDSFLDAVERLAVTSPFVFKDDNQVFKLPTGISFADVQVAITAAQQVCPYIIEFKRDAEVFFLPKLPNLEVLAHQLDRYIQIAQQMCEKFMKSEFCQNETLETVVDIEAGLSEDHIQKLLSHIRRCDVIRKDKKFRLVFMFGGETCLIGDLRERKPRMLRFLKDLEEVAVQLDRMNKGAKISNIAGSSVGAVGGVLSIIGLALIPVTAGVSLALTMTGVGLGITSGVNSIVTTSTELGVNHVQKKKAVKAFESFMKDVQCLQDCLARFPEEVKKFAEVDKVVGVLGTTGAVGKGVDALVDGAIVAAERNALRTSPRMASEIPDVGQAVAKGPLALTRGARAGFITLNALFIGMDIFIICKESISLAKGSETEFSQFLRARAALWKSEIDTWQEISDSLNRGLRSWKRDKNVLVEPFHVM